MDLNNLSRRTPGHIGRLLMKDTKNTVINYIIELRKFIKEGGYGEYNIINTLSSPGDGFFVIYVPIFLYCKLY